MPRIEKLAFKKPSFFQKLFGLKIKYNALIAINNILAQHESDVRQIRFDEIISIADEYQIDLSTNFKKERLELYHQILENSFSDLKLDEKELEKLRHLSVLLRLEERECKKELECISAKLYMKQVGDFVEKGEINDLVQKKNGLLEKKPISQD